MKPLRQISHRTLKRVALKKIQATRFESLFLCMSFSQKPLRTFGRHALADGDLPVVSGPPIKVEGLAMREGVAIRIEIPADPDLNPHRSSAVIEDAHILMVGMDLANDAGRRRCRRRSG